MKQSFTDFEAKKYNSKDVVEGWGIRWTCPNEEAAEELAKWLDEHVDKLFTELESIE